MHGTEGNRSDPAPFDIGVLFIHGIGQHKKGATLLQFGTPLIRWLKSWYRPTNENENVEYLRVVDARLTGQSNDPAVPANAELVIDRLPDETDPDPASSEKRWLFAECWWAKSFSPPSYADLAFWSLQILPYTLAAHFDRRLQRASMQVYALFFARSLQKTGLLDRPMRWNDGIARVVQYCLESIYFVMGLLLAPLLLTILLLLLLVGLIPIRWVRSAVGRVQHGLAGTIGDSYVLLSEDIVAGAIYGQVRRDLAWLAQRCRAVVVVAHSQGAAIAHRVLQMGGPQGCDLLITFGSGLRKLSEIRQLLASPRGRIPLWLITLLLVGLVFLLSFFVGRLGIVKGLMVSALLVLALFISRALRMFGVGMLGASKGAGGLGYGLITDRMAQRVRMQPHGTAQKIAILGAIAGLLGGPVLLLVTGWWVVEWLSPSVETILRVYTLLFAFALYFGDHAMWKWRAETGKLASVFPEWANLPSEDRVKSLDLPGSTKWVDLYASADPVSNGALFHQDQRPPRMEQYEVHNQASVMFDHTTYWANFEEFVPRIANEIGQLADLEVVELQRGDSERLASSAKRRRQRVEELIQGRRLMALSTVSLLIMRWGDLPALGDNVLEWLGWLLGQIPYVGSRLVGSLTEVPVGGRIVGAAGALVGFTAIYYLIFIAWTWWGRVEAKGLLSRKQNPVSRCGHGVFVFLVLAYAGYAVLLAAGNLGLYSHVFIAALAFLVTIIRIRPKTALS